MFEAAGLKRLMILILSVMLVGPAIANPIPSAELRDAIKVHALVVGIDKYKHLPELKGAVADAQDITSALQGAGVTDLIMLLNEDANRNRIIQELDHLRERVKPGDLVVLSLAGHGAQEPERIKGSESDGTETVFLLTGFDTSDAATKERILDQEFNHIIKELEAAGTRVLFVADSCSGGGLARDVDPRSAGLIYRAAPKYKISEDALKPISTAADAFATNLSFDRSIFLAAVDKYSKAPEIQIPGVSGYRGALSYALARAIEGAADSDGDGNITIKELFDYVRDVTYQLSDERQNIVALNAPKIQMAKETIFSLTRSVRVVDAPNASSEQTARSNNQTALTLSPSIAASKPLAPSKPIRLAALDGKNAQLNGLIQIESPFQIVAPAEAEFVWDPQTGDVISSGDVIARHIPKADLPSIVDRAASVRLFKQLAARAPQDVRLSPNSQVHIAGSAVEIVVSQVNNRELFLFDVAGDGTVQMLYPLGTAPKTLLTEQYSARFQVLEPFGSDQIVAVTAPRRMAELEQGFSQMNQRRMSQQIVQMLSRYPDAGLRVGLISIFTAPK